MNKRIVTDETVDEALHFLRDSARQIGDARRELIESESWIKSVEALKTLASDEKSVEARKAEARTTDEYKQANTRHAIAAGEFERLRALREAAAAIIEAWRSEQASIRASTKL